MANVKVVDAQELSDALAKKGYPFSPQRLNDLARGRLIPYVLVDGEHLRFFLKETVDAIVEDYVEKMGVVERVRPVPVFLKEPKSIGAEAVPYEIVGLIDVLRELIPTVLSGVYFLCRGDRVVYVGSSTNVYSRIVAHTDKKWDRAFYFPVIVNMLEVEAAFIAILDPHYNKGYPVKSIGGNDVVEKMLLFDGEFVSPREILEKSIGFVVPQQGEQSG